MLIPKLPIYSALIVILLLSACAKQQSAKEQLFVKLDSSQTKVNFVNALPERKGRLSIVDYLYYYNGGGVAAGDLNNDGLTDLFFVSNLRRNKLFLNKGNFNFQDISQSAGVEGFSEWKTGVTMADVNGDGWLDIYVCAVGDFMGLEGSNELYINNGNGTFNEKAADYGLNFTGFSTQAVFFDYDHDNDLDMYLLNHAVHTSRSYDRVIARMLPDKAAGDYLFKNENGKFTDVSEKAGIYQAAMGYGLGITVGDFDNDGWEDIYVSNDFHEDDYYYLNNQDGTFREEGKKAFAHFSRFSMGVDAADLNNDGYLDIMNLDMFPDDEKVEKSSVGEDALDIYLYKLSFGYHNQFSRNCLQINNGGKNFSDYGVYSGVAATDWSWSTLMADYDNDGVKDIFITNGIVKRPNNLDYLKFSHEDSMKYSPQLFDHQIDKALKKMPEGKVHDYIFKGSGSLAFEDKSEEWGFDAPDISNGAAYADLDNDGDLDLITNNLNEQAGIFKNNSSEISKNNYLKIRLKGVNGNTWGIGAKVFIKTKDGFQFQQLSPTKGFLSSVDPVLNFGLAKNTRVDSLVVIWNNNKSQTVTNVKTNQVLTLDQNVAIAAPPQLSLFPSVKPLFEELSKTTPITFSHQENQYLDFYRENLMPFLISTEGPKAAVGDVNGDGMEDVFIGNSKHKPGSLFLGKSHGFVFSPQNAFVQDSVFEDVDALLVDVDKDKDLDLYLVSGGNEFYENMDQQFDRLYINDGKGNFSRDHAALPPMFDNKSCVRACDYDKDGDVDLFVGGRVLAYHYGQSPNSYLLLNDGKGKFTDETTKLAPELRKAGMITDGRWVDTDKDGDEDLMVSGDWMPVKLFENQKGKLKEVKDLIAPASEITDLIGFLQCLNFADFDNDGDQDFVVGNLGYNTKLRKNGKESVLKMYTKDFDGNKNEEHILAYNRPDGKFYTVAIKDELSKQMPALINKEFLFYKDFAGKTVEQVFKKSKVKLEDEIVVNQFGSVYLENTGKNRFKVKALPVEAQVSKVFAMEVKDFDGDKNPDVLMGGNHHGVSTYQGRYDGSHGTLLLGDGKGNFKSVPNHLSGIWFSGQVRDIKRINHNGKTLYLIARNNEPLQLFVKLEKSTSLAKTK